MIVLGLLTFDSTTIILISNETHGCHDFTLEFHLASWTMLVICLEFYSNKLMSIKPENNV